jgi:small subunit ribosomal protein S19
MKGIKFCSLETLNTDKKKIKIFSRNSIILDYHIGKTFYVHVGNRFFILSVDSRMKGYRFGDFCMTRKPFSHKKKNK